MPVRLANSVLYTRDNANRIEQQSSVTAAESNLTYQPEERLLGEDSPQSPSQTIPISIAADFDFGNPYCCFNNDEEELNLLGELDRRPHSNLPPLPPTTQSSKLTTTIERRRELFRTNTGRQLHSSFGGTRSTSSSIGCGRFHRASPVNFSFDSSHTQRYPFHPIPASAFHHHLQSPASSVASFGTIFAPGVSPRHHYLSGSPQHRNQLRSSSPTRRCFFAVGLARSLANLVI